MFDTGDMASADNLPTHRCSHTRTHTFIFIIAYILINNSPTDPVPTDITTRCPRSYSRTDERYRINFTWSVPFSAAVLCAVNNFRVTATQVDDRGRTQPFTFEGARRNVLPNVSLKTRYYGHASAVFLIYIFHTGWQS